MRMISKAFPALRDYVMEGCSLRARVPSKSLSAVAVLMALQRCDLVIIPGYSWMFAVCEHGGSKSCKAVIPFTNHQRLPQGCRCIASPAMTLTNLFRERFILGLRFEIHV